jgi:hypothetical protein
MSPQDLAKSLTFPVTDILKLHAKGRSRPGDLFVKETKTRGRGVFAGRDFEANECLELCPALVIPASDIEWFVDTAIDGFWYQSDDSDDCLLALGFGSLYNHSYKPNAWFDVHGRERIISFWAARKIRKGREIRINYNPAEGQEKVWFDVDAATAKERAPDMRIHFLTNSSIGRLSWCGVDPEDEELQFSLLPERTTCRECRACLRRFKMRLRDFR